MGRYIGRKCKILAGEGIRFSVAGAINSSIGTRAGRLCCLMQILVTSAKLRSLVLDRFDSG